MHTDPTPNETSAVKLRPETSTLPWTGTLAPHRPQHGKPHTNPRDMLVFSLPHLHRDTNPHIVHSSAVYHLDGRH